MVRKAGDIIPEVIAVKNHPEGTSAYTLPTHCPSCGTLLVRDPEVAAIRCPNISCPAQILRSLIHFCSRNAMDIEGLGEAVCEQLLATGLAKTPADLYRLTKEELLGLEGFQKKKAENILSALEKSKHNELGALLFGLAISAIKRRSCWRSGLVPCRRWKRLRKRSCFPLKALVRSWPRVFCNTLTMKITVGCAMICWPLVWSRGCQSSNRPLWRG